MKLTSTRSENLRRDIIKTADFLVLSSERRERNKMEGVGAGGIAPELSKVEIEAKIQGNSSALIEEKAAVVR